MLYKVQPYSYKNVTSFGSFQRNAIPLHYKKNSIDYVPVNVSDNFFKNIKNIFFEMFPKLDPEFSKFFKNINVKG